ncbi:Glycosyltransferase [Granulibacter bethesdensis]|uniref:Glycosyltransferase n=3 Tax=Granulibacter bethesdensis TaxID=364410 RepID=Q0BSR9_GRABC|nr:Glycosyltransferase [Granulibacter bethesdensis CGDNIH1]AHJ63036.1 Glycosyltransferase [Granulibacter bethesdensis]AHJ68964.1 Glycosyltransferase [Granulibacter bethesdensis]APH51960.1 Glycosyltransferase [Granulibacter bethesdensis]APH64649.1 Glycosyltransferase [Granulibacter bethesdensis]
MNHSGMQGMDVSGSAMSTPKSLHFCWIGSRLPWAYGIALLSAAAHGEADEVILHHTDELESSQVLDALRAVSSIRVSRIDPQALLQSVGAELGLDDKLWVIYSRVSSPAILSDILRAAILYRDGGIYLDVDTVTIAPFSSLFQLQQFIGVERIVWPYWVKSSRSPFVWGWALALDVMRKAMRVLPEGWRFYRYVEKAYFRGINGAIMGGAPKAPLFEIYLRHMVAMSADKQVKPNALGPDLLQELIGQGLIPDLVVHDPEYFYPLAPEISEHWFRLCRHAPDAFRKALMPQTIVVHWYASVRTKSYVEKIDPQYIQANQQTQLYSALVAQMLPELLHQDGT